MATSEAETETSSEDIGKSCDACKLLGKINVAAVFCRTCNQFQCDSCNRMHSIFPALANHSIINVDDSAAGKGEFNMQNLDRCTKHDKRFKFYCKVDNELCCSTCAISSHIHKCGGVGEIDSFIESNDEDMKRLKDKIQTQNFKSTVLLSSGAEIKTQIRKVQADKLQKIDEAKDQVIQLFDSFKTEFRTKTDEAIDEVEAAIDNEQGTVTEANDTRDTLETFLDNVANDGTPRQIFTTINIYNKRVEQFEKPLELSCDQLQTLNIDFSLNKGLVKILDLTEKIGEISLEKKKVYEPLGLKQAVSVDLKPSDEEEPFIITGLDFMSDGKIVAVDNRNNKLLLMDSQLQVLGQNTVDSKPFDVAVMPENRIVLSSNYKLNRYTVNEDNTPTHLDTIETSSSYFSLYALDDRTIVTSTFDTEGPAKLVTITREETDFDLPWQQSTYEFDQSKVTYIPSLDMLVLTDQKAHKCYLWNVKEKTKIVVEDERIREPKGVCATKSGIIFVCSSETNSIVQISPTGKVLASTCLSEWPYSIAVSHDDKQLLVYNSTTSGTRKLQLFNI